MVWSCPFWLAKKIAEWLPNDPELKTHLAEYLCIAFAHLESHELAHLPLSSNPPQEGAQYGLCSGISARALFYATVEGIIVPNLQQYMASMQRGLGKIEHLREKTSRIPFNREIGYMRTAPAIFEYRRVLNPRSLESFAHV